MIADMCDCFVPMAAFCQALLSCARSFQLHNIVCRQIFRMKHDLACCGVKHAALDVTHVDKCTYSVEVAVIVV